MELRSVRQNLCGQVIDDLGRRIVRGEVQPGDALPQEAALCHQLGVSRTVVREAVKALAAKGLVDSRPKRGTVVRPSRAWSFLDPEVLQWQTETDPDGRQLTYLTELRQAVEPVAAAMAAARASEEEICADCRSMPGDGGLRRERGGVSCRRSPLPHPGPARLRQPVLCPGGSRRQFRPAFELAGDQSATGRQCDVCPRSSTRLEGNPRP